MIQQFYFQMHMYICICYVCTSIHIYIDMCVLYTYKHCPYAHWNVYIYLSQINLSTNSYNIIIHNIPKVEKF